MRKIIHLIGCIGLAITAVTAHADNSFKELPEGTEQEWLRITQAIPKKFMTCIFYRYRDGLHANRTPILHKQSCTQGHAIVLRGGYIILPWHLLRETKMEIEQYLTKENIPFRDVETGDEGERWQLDLGDGTRIFHAAFTLLYEDAGADFALLRVASPACSLSLYELPATIDIAPKGGSEKLYLPGRQRGEDITKHVRIGRKNYVNVDDYNRPGTYFGARIHILGGDSGIPLFAYRNGGFRFVGMALGRKYTPYISVSWYADVYEIARTIKTITGINLFEEERQVSVR
jgi:hypothetical protein